MGLDGVLADEQFGCDLGVGQASRDETQDVDLTGRELVGLRRPGLWRTCGDAVHQTPSYRGGEQGVGATGRASTGGRLRRHGGSRVRRPRIPRPAPVPLSEPSNGATSREKAAAALQATVTAISGRHHTIASGRQTARLASTAAHARVASGSALVDSSANPAPMAPAPITTHRWAATRRQRRSSVEGGVGSAARGPRRLE